jgi:hypothetical protein
MAAMALTGHLVFVVVAATCTEACAGCYNHAKETPPREGSLRLVRRKQLQLGLRGSSVRLRVMLNEYSYLSTHDLLVG